ncbi:unnamed protein product [Rotaria socialis]|nr:unnamed protein product [Rotaria socialis]CAF3729975.1 unnamed protein product [Rotaria socialis]
MLITLCLHCSLKDTKAHGFFTQIILIDPAHDVLLNISCLLNNRFFNKHCNTFNNSDTNLDTSPFSTRFCDAFNFSYSLDIFTVYFLVWQVMFLITAWELQILPLISLTFFRGCQCMIPAFIMYFVYDFFFRLLPMEVNFLLIWIFALADIIYCLHPRYHIESSRILDELSTDGTPSLVGFYYTLNFDDDELVDRKNNRSSLGIGDFLIFNLMLLLIVPSGSSMITKVCIAIGHIIAIQIGQIATSWFGCYFNQYLLPALPLPVACFSLYAILLNAFVQY